MERPRGKFQENKRILIKFAGVIAFGVIMGMMVSQIVINNFVDPINMDGVQDSSNRIRILGLFGVFLWLTVWGIFIYSAKTGKAWINSAGIGSLIYFFLLAFSTFLVGEWMLFSFFN